MVGHNTTQRNGKRREIGRTPERGYHHNSLFNPASFFSPTRITSVTLDHASFTSAYCTHGSDVIDDACGSRFISTNNLITFQTPTYSF